MELNLRLEKNLRDILKQHTNEKPIYCIQPDLNTAGKYTKDCFLVVTKSFLFALSGEDVKVYPLNTLETALHRVYPNSAALVVKKEGAEFIVALCSMRYVSLFACLAKGIRLLIEGETEKRVENKEREKYCPKCGRVLPDTDNCPKCDKEHRNLKRLSALCKPHIPALIFISLLMLVDSSISLGQQYILRLFVDNHLAKGIGTILDVLAFFALYFGIILFGLFIHYVKAYTSGKLGVSVSQDLRKQLSDHIQKMSLSFLTKRDAGEITERVMGDTGRIKDFIGDCISSAFNQIITMLALAITLLIMNWKLALAVFIFAPPVVIFTKTFWPRIRRMYHRQWRKTDRIQNKLQDVLSGIRIVKTYGKEKSEAEEFLQLNDELAHTQRKNEKFFATFYPIITLTFSFSTYLIVYLGGMDVLGGTMSPGELMQFIAYAGMLLGPLSWMSFLPRRIVNTTTSLERIYDILDQKPEIASKEKAIKKEIEGNVSVENIVFGYRSWEPVLEDVSLEVKKGEMIGLVGSSGCGKSTFINLIMRLYDVNEGSIKIDGIDLKDMELYDFHRQIGVVLQETFLFAGSVMDNIRFAKPNASMEEVIKAAKAANAHDFICKMPDGYNTYVGEKGHKLSGGEKQRIAIARAILNDPKILILDEATSALDTESEYQVQQALERLRKDRTTFAIAHRLSTLRCADRIAVIDNHKIAELGTHNELLRKKGIYYSLVMAQLQMNKTASDN